MNLHDNLSGLWLEDRYRLLTQLGHGGEGAVYLALDNLPTPVTYVAVKTLDQRDHAAIKMAVEVGRRVQSLPGIVQYRDVQAKGTPSFVVMEYLRGSSFRDKLRNLLVQAVASNVLDRIGTVAEILLASLKALNKLHGVGILHRDIKPENVFVGDDGESAEVKLFDLGLATLPRDAPADAIRPPGTDGYIAKELWDCESPTESSDLYAFGVMAFEAIAEVMPFAGRDWKMLRLQHLRSAPPRLLQVRPDLLDAPGTEVQAALKTLDEGINHLLDKNPSNRLAGVRKLKERGCLPLLSRMR